MVEAIARLMKERQVALSCMFHRKLSNRDITELLIPETSILNAELRTDAKWL